ncbi:MAG: hypothetical protein V1651_00940 [Patescibacteria group bacterium]
MTEIKKVVDKKNIIYFIIFIIVLGIIFLFYQKYKPMIASKTGSIAEQITIPKQTKEEISIFDTTVLKSAKYQILSDNSVLLINKKEDIGKRDPFEKYK